VANHARKREGRPLEGPCFGHRRLSGTETSLSHFFEVRGAIGGRDAGEALELFQRRTPRRRLGFLQPLDGLPAAAETLGERRVVDTVLILPSLEFCKHRSGNVRFMDKTVKRKCPESDVPSFGLPVHNMDMPDNCLAAWRARYLEVRKERLSQQDLGDIIGVSHQTIGRMEKGQQGIKLEHLTKLGAFFGVPRWAIIDVDPSTADGAIMADLLEIWEMIEPTQRPAALAMLRAFAASYPLARVS